jgi:hypothetical protein
MVEFTHWLAAWLPTLFAWLGFLFVVAIALSLVLIGYWGMQSEPEGNQLVSTILFTILAVFVGIFALVTLAVPFTHPFKQPETALTWIAFLVSVSAYLQLVTRYKHGITYQLLPPSEKLLIDTTITEPSPIRGWVAFTMKSSYWVFIVLAVLLGAQLVYGTFSPIRSQDTIDILNSNNETRQMISDQYKLISQQNQDVIQRLDRLISLMESGNVTITK